MKGVSSTSPKILADGGIKRVTDVNGFGKGGIVKKGEDVMEGICG